MKMFRTFFRCCIPREDKWDKESSLDNKFLKADRKPKETIEDIITEYRIGFEEKKESPNEIDKDEINSQKFNYTGTSSFNDKNDGEIVSDLDTLLFDEVLIRNDEKELIIYVSL